MQNTTADYKLEINKPSRSFQCKITIGNNIYSNEDLVNLTLEYTQPQEGFSIGGTISQSLDLTLLNRGDIIYSTSQIKVEIGLKIGDKIEYIPMGIFNIDDIDKTDYTTKITAYDNIIKFETDYFSELGDKPTLKQVVNELSSKTGVEFTGSLPDYNVSKLEGFTCREVLSYVASICGGNAFITRDGKFTIKSLSEVEKSIDGNNYFDYTREEVKYKVGQISCQVDENNILSKGSVSTDSMELGFENPWVTETILTEIYNKLNGLSYLGYSMKWQGDISLDPYDIITVTDIKNVVRKIPILSQKLSYTGGLTSEIGAKGETKNRNSFSSSGSTTNKVNRLVTEQAVIKEALIEKANIKDLEAVSIRTQTLEAKTAKLEEAIIDVAYVSDLTAINANIKTLFANDATINNALIGKADITELNAVQGNITSLNSQVANIQTLVNGNLSSENIQTGGITSDKLTIADGFITNAMIANLDVSKIIAGDISSTKFRIVSDSGKMLISDNTIQISDNNRVRVQIGKDASNDYNMYVWDSAGKLMFDATGLKADGIKNKIIRDDMISDNANIGGSKINISSLITEINKDTNTSVIKSTKVQIDSLKQTLDVAFTSLKTQADSTKSLTESNSTTIGVMQGQITTAINNTQIVKDGQTILLKDDYNRTVTLVDSINSTIGTHTTKINELTGSITSVDTKVNSVQRDLEGTKSTVSSHSTSISDLSSKVSTQGSSISQLQNQIALKVESEDITNAINNVQIGGRNLLINSDNGYLSDLKVYNNSAVSYSDVDGWRRMTFTNQLNNEIVHSKWYTPVQLGDYTFSIMCRTDATSISTNISVFTNEAGHRVVAASVTSLGNGLYKIVASFSISNLNNLRVVDLSSFKTIGATYVEFRYPMLEVGNKSSSWRPAVEDVDTSIENVQSQVITTSNKVATIETNLNSITQRVSSTESTVSTHTTQLGTVDSRINTAKSSAISTASSDATTKANNALSSAKSYTDGQITTVNQTITNKVAEIKTTTDSITQRVSATESKITTVTTDFNNMQIGGTNLATETNKGVTGWGWALQTGSATFSEVAENGIRCCKMVRDSVASTGWSYIKYSRIGRSKYLPSRKYTVSFEVKASVVTAFYVGLKEGNSSNPLTGDVKTGNTVANTWTKLSATITTLSTIPSSTSQVLYLNGMDSGIGVTYIFRNLKIEEGTKASNWSPAPEDIDSSIANVQTQITTTSNKVATIETNLSSITSRVSSTESSISTINGNVASLQSRMSTAEQKITDSAIINTVKETINTAKNEAINSANSSTDNKLKSYATTSSLTQTANSITASFKSSGGFNLLKNSDAKNGTVYWIDNGGGLSITIAGANPFNGEKEFKTSFPYGLKYSEDIRLKANTDYVYEAWIYTNTAITSSSITPLHFWCSSEAGVSGQSQCTVIDYRQTLTVNAYTKVYVHFKTKSGNVFFRPFIYSSATAGMICVKQISLSESTLESAWTPHPDEVYSGSTIIDASGVTINNGALTIKNKSGTTVLNSDTNGNLVITGTLKSQKGDMFVSLDSGGISFQDYQKQEQMLRIATIAFSDNRDINGITFAMPQYSDFIRFAHISKADLTNGWTSSDVQYKYFDCWSSNQTVGGASYKKGLTVYAPMYIENELYINSTNGIKLKNTTSSTSDIKPSLTWNTIDGLLGVYGDNGVLLGYKNGETYQTRLILTEGAHPGTGDHIKSYGNWNLSGYTIHNGTFAGSFVNTYANEVTRTVAQTFGIEAEETQVRVVFEEIQITNGTAILNIPNKYNGICTGYTIVSIVKKGKGDVWVAEEQENRFIIEADNDIKINVELIVKL